ncbi:MAG TPA: hypothetical protein VED63_09170 [Acidimicrobiales bacterium]|nr:hypothetical protein [Acidimicrobiales bacterium]
MDQTDPHDGGHSRLILAVSCFALGVVLFGAPSAAAWVAAGHQGANSLSTAAWGNLVQQAVTGGAALTSVTITLPGSTTAGDTLILSVADDSNHNATVSSVLGGGVTTWIKATSAAAATSLEGEVEIWYGAVTTSSTSSVAVSLTGSTNVQLANVSEWSGLAASSPLDATTSTAPGVSATNFTAGPITPTVTGDLIITDAWIQATGDTSPQDATTGYSALSQTTGGGSYFRGWIAYQIDGSTASMSATWTSPASGYYATAIAAFKP